MENIENREFWLVWQPETGKTMYKHYQLIDAINEAKRLASVNSGKEFYVLCAQKRVIKDDIKITNLDDGVPF